MDVVFRCCLGVIVWFVYGHFTFITKKLNSLSRVNSRFAPLKTPPSPIATSSMSIHKHNICLANYNLFVHRINNCKSDNLNTIKYFIKWKNKSFSLSQESIRTKLSTSKVGVTSAYILSFLDLTCGITLGM